MAAVRCRPPTVCPLDQVGDDDVSVELGVAGPAGAMAEGGTDEAVGFQQLLSPGTSPDEAGLCRQVVEHGTDGPVVGLRDPVPSVIRSECPQERDALGGGEGEVVAGAAVGRQPCSEGLSRGGPAGQQVRERGGVDLSDESELLRHRPDPVARRLAPAQVVVVDVVGHLVEVVLGATGDTESRYRQHRGIRMRAFGDRSTVVWSGTTSPSTSPSTIRADYQDLWESETAHFRPDGEGTRPSAVVWIIQVTA